MKGIMAKEWLLRFGRMYGIVLVVLVPVELFKGAVLAEAMRHGLFWAGASSLVYCLVLAYRHRRERAYMERAMQGASQERQG
ncbi:hypothetical protein [Microbulbifer sediminum]|uniref:hypothetical protein n=1 Tax=Microbulbifer sediminum TaxID=2904250 RepID=UPI001F3FBC80|nr:hypothetical protein [Microbulbifer sediminum]